MHGEGCWSTVVCRPTERAALGLSEDSEWLLQCRLPIGHRGNHATDASTRPRHDRRLWLEWNDFDNRAQSLIERNPCAVPSPDGNRCVYFAGHGGAHFFAPSNGHAPSVMTGAGTGNQHRPAPAASTQVPPTPPATRPAGPPQRAGSHRLPDSHQPAPPAVPPAPETREAAEPVYRGGRRASNAEAPAPDGSPTTEGYQGRRHRPEVAGVEQTADGETSGRHGGGHAAPEPPDLPDAASAAQHAVSDVPGQHTAPEAPSQHTAPEAPSQHTAPEAPSQHTAQDAPGHHSAPEVPSAGSGTGAVSRPTIGTAEPGTDSGLPDTARRAAISEALGEVAAALAKLAAALRA
ncbi:hypothetical protein [Gordonia aurantiaca]|uniref:hypothetical protein n=1 Tax=Gordonia sp. B21 TaxID=3151852 RepID=UPI003266BA39